MRYRSVVLLGVAACGRIGIDPIDDPGEVDAMSVELDRASVLADGPIALWAFEDGDAVARDLVGSTNGAIVGDVRYEAGIVGTALRFDGTTTVDFGDVAVPTAPFTLELWAKIRSLDDQVRFVVDWGSVDTRYAIYSAEAFTMAHREIGAASHGYVKASPLVLDRWVHVVFACDGAQATLYLDGQRFVGAPGPIVPPSAGRLVIGDLLAGSPHKLIGALDEIAVYDRVLPSDRVRDHYITRQAP